MICVPTPRRSTRPGAVPIRQGSGRSHSGTADTLGYDPLAVAAVLIAALLQASRTGGRPGGRSRGTLWRGSPRVWRPVHAGHSRHCRRTAIGAGQGGVHKRASGPCALRAGPKVPGSARLARRIVTSGPSPKQILATGFGGRQHVILPAGDVARIPGGGPGGAGAARPEWR